MKLEKIKYTKFSGIFSEYVVDFNSTFKINATRSCRPGLVGNKPDGLSYYY